MCMCVQSEQKKRKEVVLREEGRVEGGWVEEGRREGERERETHLKGAAH